MLLEIDVLTRHIYIDWRAPINHNVKARIIVTIIKPWGSIHFTDLQKARHLDRAWLGIRKCHGCIFQTSQNWLATQSVFELRFSGFNNVFLPPHYYSKAIVNGGLVVGGLTCLQTTHENVAIPRLGNSMTFIYYVCIPGQNPVQTCCVKSKTFPCVLYQRNPNVVNDNQKQVSHT